MLRVFQSTGLGVSLSPFLSHHSSTFLSSTFPTHAAAKLLLPLVLSHRPSSSTTTTSLPSMSAVRSQSNPDVTSTSSSPASVVRKKVSFCQSCGGPTKQIIPEGDEKLRAVCSLCGKVFYENPKMVVGCLVEHDNKILLCKRKIQPSYGLWTLPAGYLEIGESAIEGAARETLEEACAEVEVLSPFAQLDIPRIGQSYIIFRAKLKKPHFSPGAESLECALFNLDEIPFEALAFSSIFVTLKMYIEDVKMGGLKFHYCIINKRPGSSPSDTHGFVVDDHLQS